MDNKMDAAEKRSHVVKWLNSIIPDFNLSVDATEDELRAQLSSGVILCAILNRKSLVSIKSQRGVFISSEQRAYNLRRFLSAMDEMGLPKFNASDLEKGSMSAVVDCLFALSERMGSSVGDDTFNGTKFGSQRMKSLSLLQGGRTETMDVSRGRQSVPDTPVSRYDRRGSQSMSGMPNLSEASAASLHNVRHKFHDVFQLKQGRYTDLPAAKISEMMKSNSLDNAPTQSLLSVVNGILDESTERKSGEIPHRVACLLRKVVQEIERRISTQADHIKNQNTLIKAREEKYQSRIRVLETLASGTNEETETVANQLEKMKTEKSKTEVIKKHGDQDIDVLMKEKEEKDHTISQLKKELKNMDILVKEKENSDRTTSQLKQELKNMDKLLREKEKSDRATAEPKQDSKNMDKLTKEKENSDHMISELKQNMDKLVKEKETSDQIISELKQELKNMNILMKETGNNDNMTSKLKQELEKMDTLMKEKENGDRMISELKLELENMNKLLREKENSDRATEEPKQDSKNMDKLTKEKENSDRMISELKQNMDKLVKEKETSDRIISELKQELKNMDVFMKETGNNDNATSKLQQELQKVETLMKEKQNGDRMISELKLELENMNKLLREKKNSDRATEEPKQDSKNMDKLTKEKENSDRMISELKQNMDKLVKEKETSDRIISELKQELKNMDILMKETGNNDNATSKLQQELQKVETLMKEKQNGDRMISELKLELENMNKLVKEKENGNRTTSEINEDLKNMDKLVREKENSDRIISELKLELKNMDKLVTEKENSDRIISELRLQVENMDKLVKEKGNSEHIISVLKLEMENMDKLVKEKENSEHIISELKQELKNMDNLAKEKENSEHIISELKEELKNMDNLAKEKENSEHIISELKQKLKNMDNLAKEKENSEHIISELKEELKNMDSLAKEKENSYSIISELKQKIDKLVKEKENSDRIISELKQKIDKLVKEKENSDRIVLELKEELKIVDILMTDKENSDRIISELKQELENSTNSYQQLEINKKEIKEELEDRIREVETLLAESKVRTNEIETIAESKFQKWNKKELLVQNFLGIHIKSVKNMKIASDSIKQEVISSQKKWREEVINFGSKLKRLVDAAEKYKVVLAENRKLYNDVLELKGNIRVCCRVRPFLANQAGKATIVDHIGEDGEIVVANPSKQGKEASRLFKFNKVFGPTSTQEQVYLDIQPLVRSVIDGFNVCIFAYGQTGSGKTYTMSGPNSPTETELGVNYRALNDLFNLSIARSSDFSYDIGVQMVEIYNEQVRDLLTSNSQKNLGIMTTSQSNGLAVPDASMLPVKSTKDVLELMQFGFSNRAMSSTALNERSSRSHSVVTVHVQGKDLRSGSVSCGCLHLIDLAGSERINRSEVTGDRLKEAQHINKSLSALGDVIFALAQKNNHVPYRNSKLTQVLQSSLGGHAKTLMFIQVNPDMDSYSETLSTLKFAERVSGVELGAAKSTKEGKDVRDLMEQVASLKDTIARKDEEIEELQLLNGGSPDGQNSLKHSASSSGISSLSSQRAQQPSARRVTGLGDQGSENDNDNGSQQINGGEMGEGFPSDADLVSLEETESEDVLSDASDGGVETESASAENTVTRETGKSVGALKEKFTRAAAPSTRVSKPVPSRTGVAGPTTSTRLKPKEPLAAAKPAVPARKSTVSQTTSSTSKPLIKR